MPRMTNTIMLAGDHDPAEIIASVEDGLYAVNFGGGQVDITSGKFVFSAAEAWMIENGKLAYPVKGATLIGNGPDALTKVSMVGNDLALDAGSARAARTARACPSASGSRRSRSTGSPSAAPARSVGLRRTSAHAWEGSYIVEAGAAPDG